MGAQKPVKQSTSVLKNNHIIITILNLKHKTMSLNLTVFTCLFVHWCVVVRAEISRNVDLRWPSTNENKRDTT